MLLHQCREKRCVVVYARKHKNSRKAEKSFIKYGDIFFSIFVIDIKIYLKSHLRLILNRKTNCVKPTLEQAMKAKRGSRGIVLLFL